MIKDTFTTLKNGEVKILDIPSGVRESYRKIAIWLAGNNYRIPSGLLKSIRREAMDSNIFLHEGGPIYKDEPGATVEQPGWYFWDETLAHYHGPFATQQEADAALTAYAEAL
jgi:hypothetical protein